MNNIEPLIKKSELTKENLISSLNNLHKNYKLFTATVIKLFVITFIKLFSPSAVITGQSGLLFMILLITESLRKLETTIALLLLHIILESVIFVKLVLKKNKNSKLMLCYIILLT